MIRTTTAITQDVSVCANVLSHWLYLLLPRATEFDSYLLTVSLPPFEKKTSFLNKISAVIQQCGISTSVDSDEPVQPPVKLRNSK